jgi:hypothetical protein
VHVDLPTAAQLFCTLPLKLILCRLSDSDSLPMSLTSPRSGGIQAAKAPWVVVSDDVRRVFTDAISKRDALNSINLGPTRTYSVAEAVLWAGLARRFASLFRDAKAINKAINKLLVSDVFGPRPLS